MEKVDVVNNPAHYTGTKANIECRLFTLWLDAPFSNAFKYVWRAGKKDSFEQDISKAETYLKYAHADLAYNEHKGILRDLLNSIDKSQLVNGSFEAQFSKQETLMSIIDGDKASALRWLSKYRKEYLNGTEAICKSCVMKGE